MNNKNDYNNNYNNKNKKTRSALFLIIGSLFVLSFLAFASNAAYAAGGLFGGGTGTADDPYIIEDTADLDAVRNGLDAHYKLGNDINLKAGDPGFDTEEGWLPIGDDWGNCFAGSFDGDGHKITGLWINRPETGNIGLFGVIARESEIKNLGIEIDATYTDDTGRVIGIRGNYYVGGLASYSQGNIENCYVTGGPVTGYGTVSGLLWYNGGTIENCYVTSAVSCIEEYGTASGLVEQNGGIIKNSYTTGDVSSHGLTSGLVIVNFEIIENSYATGNVSSIEEASGLVYQNSGTLTNSHATGNVSGSQSAGGLVMTNSGTIENSHATGNVSSIGEYGKAGGLAAESDGLIENSYATGDVSSIGEYGQAGGLVGCNGGPIENSYATGDVSSSGEYGRAGGLVGDNGGPIENSYATGDVSSIGEYGQAGGLVAQNSGSIGNSYAIGDVSSNENAGGLVGWNYYLIENSYATGNVSSNENDGGLVANNNDPIDEYDTSEEIISTPNAGGFVGLNYYGIIENCYATGYISSNGNAGGFVGQNLDGMIIACYFDTDTTGTAYGGFDNTTNEGVTDITGLTTSEMKKMAVFEGSGWDISASDSHETVWGLYLKGGDTDETLTGYGYPYIKTINNDVLIVPDSTGKTHDGNPAPFSIGYTIISDNPTVDAAKAVIGTLGYADLEGNPISPPTNAGTYGIIQNTLNSPYYQISVKEGATYTIDGAASNNRPSSSGTGSGTGTGSVVVNNSAPPSGSYSPVADVTVTDEAPPAKDGNKMLFLGSWIAIIAIAIFVFSWQRQKRQ